MKSEDAPVKYSQTQLMNDFKDLSNAMIIKIVESFPVAGPAISGFWEFIAQRNQRRILDFSALVMEALNSHKHFEGQITAEKIIDIFESVALNAIKTDEQEKLLHYRNLFINSCSNKHEIEQGEIEIFMQLIKEFTPVHIYLIKKYHEHSNFRLTNKQVEDTLHNLGVSKDTLQFHCQWLESRSLLREITGDEKKMWSIAGYDFEELIKTPYLDKFAKFILDNG
ncbi:MAG: hypothetical protein WCP79_14715 [Bacillota bacterium]